MSWERKPVPPSVLRFFVGSSRVPVFASVIVAVVVFLIVRTMWMCVYSPGIVVRLVGACVALMLAAYAVAWVWARRARPVFLSIVLVAAAVALPTTVWTAVVVANPVGGTVGTLEHPAYLGDNFEVVAKTWNYDRYTTVVGTVVAVQEVPVDLRSEDPPEGDYRCWAVKVEMTLGTDGSRGIDPKSVGEWGIGPLVEVSIPDGTVAEADFTGPNACEHDAGMSEDFIRTSVPEHFGVVTFTYWFVTGFYSDEEPSLVTVAVSGQEPKSYFVPRFEHNGCYREEDCDGLLTLDEIAARYEDIQKELIPAE